MRTVRYGASWPESEVYAGHLTGYQVPEDRYAFDFTLMPTGRWAQMDTSQDAPYFGTWANPLSLKVVTWCEGDLTITHCDSDSEFVEAVRQHAASDDFLGIDPGLTQKLRDRFVELGLADLLHGSEVS